MLWGIDCAGCASGNRAADHSETMHAARCTRTGLVNWEEDTHPNSAGVDGMPNKANALPQDRFVAIWNMAGSLDEAVAHIPSLVGRPCPRWAIMARAISCRKDGVPLQRFADADLKAAS